VEQFYLSLNVLTIQICGNNLSLLSAKLSTVCVTCHTVHSVFLSSLCVTYHTVHSVALFTICVTCNTLCSDVFLFILICAGTIFNIKFQYILFFLRYCKKKFLLILEVYYFILFIVDIIYLKKTIFHWLGECEKIFLLSSSNMCNVCLMDRILL